VISIPEGKLLAGSLPRAKLKLVAAWIEIHQEELMANWKLAVRGEPVFKIEPLRRPMNPRVARVVPESGHRLRLTFTNGEVRVFDVTPWLAKGVFRELRDEAIFKSVRPWHGTVQWSGGQDLCPDTLYEDGVPIGATGEVSGKSGRTRVRRS